MDYIGCHMYMFYTIHNVFVDALYMWSFFFSRKKLMCGNTLS